MGGLDALRGVINGGRDLLCQIPASRWDVEQAALDLVGSPPEVASRVRHGGFLCDAELFEHGFFSISAAEASAMDPQQRLLLELGYAALHGSSRRRSVLSGGGTGVFVGIERPDWALAQPPSARASVYAVTGDNVSVASGRVSFVLGLHGPCSSVDTACASALCALHGGASAVRAGECVGGGVSDGASAALALAVSLKLAPYGTLGAASAGMLSIDGRCKTLDARANGYARTEGVGALVLESVGVAASSCALLLGSGVRQDGRSASLTAPNGSAQRTLLAHVLGRSSVAAAQLGWVEAHGTGTALGDPTEAGSLVAVLGAASSTPSRGAVSIAAAKASVGHSEAASGAAGLLRAAQQLSVQSVSGNAQLRVLNPLVGARLGGGAAAFGLPTQVGAAAAPAACGGVSSFGFSGTIAHAVLRHQGRTSAMHTLFAYRRHAFPWRDAASFALRVITTIVP